ncbi:MAG TPA: proline dehydrogenase family protein, partial [Cytophagales bacterium]|nr:proline dehydrogenase family protein [Cytophagales bacterium]
MKIEDLAKRSVSLAKELQEKTLAGSSSSFSKRLKPLLQYPAAKAFLIHLLDVAFRSDSYVRIAQFVSKLFSTSQSHTVLFSWTEQKLIKIFLVIGYRFPNISIPFMRRKIAAVSENVVFVHGSNTFHKHATKRKQDGIALNINLIGESLMGEIEAQERIDKYCRLLNEPDVDYISVKISTIYSQIESIAYEETLSVLKDRLTLLYQELVLIHARTGRWKFINLDMEEYRDLSLTVDTFMGTLSQPQFKQLSAGIV